MSNAREPESFDDYFDRIRSDVETVSRGIDLLYKNFHAPITRLEKALGLPVSKGPPEARIDGVISYLKSRG